MKQVAHASAMSIIVIVFLVALMLVDQAEIDRRAVGDGIRAARTDGLAEHYEGKIKRFGVDIGFTKQAQLTWLVFAPGVVAPGALAGNYAGAAMQAALGAGMGSNVLAGGSNKLISLQPVNVAGAEGLNAAGGLAEISLHATR
jgi:hypothetical protein